jgi:hypothetical protein
MKNVLNQLLLTIALFLTVFGCRTKDAKKSPADQTTKAEAKKTINNMKKIDHAFQT